MSKITRPVIWLASEDWAPNVAQASFHITDVLSDSVPVLFCNTIGIRKPAVAKSDISRFISKITSFLKGLERKKKNLWVLNPLGVPVSLGKWTDSINTRLVYYQILTALGKTGISLSNALVWVSFPGWAPVVKKLSLPPERLIVHFFDRWESFGRVDQSQVLKLRGVLLSSAGAVLCSGEDLKNELDDLHSNVSLAPHGIKLELFSTNEIKNKSSEIRDIPEPIAGYFGKLNSFWIDYDLIYRCAKYNNKISWVFLGKEGYLSPSDVVRRRELEQLPNVHFLGMKNHEDLPTYGRCFNVGLLPFKDSELTRSATPLKLLEYLALGLPVVSTIPQQFGQFKELVCIAGNDPYQFFNRLVSSLSQTEADKKSRQDSVKLFDWKNMVDVYLQYLDESGIDLK